MYMFLEFNDKSEKKKKKVNKDTVDNSASNEEELIKKNHLQRKSIKSLEGLDDSQGSDSEEEDVDLVA